MSFLPPEFIKMMESLLQDEYSSFLESIQNKAARSLRINSLKASSSALNLPFLLAPVPWTQDAFYYNPMEYVPQNHIYHAIGLYTIQEPSAMAPVEALDPQPSEKILDLCAAPGGKATQIATKLKGNGILVANEIDPLKVNTLTKNINRFGIKNYVIMNEKPASLKTFFHSFFDRILIDAPSSGEALFRKNREIFKNWSPFLLTRCQETQLDILQTAAPLLRPGGRLVYSTETFNEIENERTVEQFLENNPEFQLLSIEETAQGMFKPGFDRLQRTKRLWPHHAYGEGQFIAAFKKLDGKKRKKWKQKEKAHLGKEKNAIYTFLDSINCNVGTELLILKNEDVYLVPDEFPIVKQLKVIQPGRYLGKVHKEHFIPSHAFALSLQANDTFQPVNFELNDPDLKKYLQGETLPTTLDSGWKLVTVNHFSLGWAKVSDQLLKNHYPKALRWNESWFSY
jgi:16S rRNA C967 or C1407 C5-methylase (RsmB/RsmF family)/NOL1/NOP2/fmu family ribosome biogenesis protein